MYGGVEKLEDNIGCDDVPWLAFMSCTGGLSTRYSLIPP
jgi:hypothetical protein